MTEDKKVAEDIKDEDLDQAQGGVIINGDHMPSGDQIAVQIDDNHQVVMGGTNPFNTADRTEPTMDVVASTNEFDSFS